MICSLFKWSGPCLNDLFLVFKICSFASIHWLIALHNYRFTSDFYTCFLCLSVYVTLSILIKLVCSIVNNFYLFWSYKTCLCLSLLVYILRCLSNWRLHTCVHTVSHFNEKTRNSKVVVLDLFICAINKDIYSVNIENNSDLNS